GEELQSSREHKDLPQSALQAHDAAAEITHPERLPLVSRNKAGSRGKFQRYAGKVTASLSMADTARAHSGRMQKDGCSCGRLQNNKVVHLPVQDAWSLEVAEILKLYTQRTAGKIERAGKPDDVRQGCAAQRKRETLAQGRQVNLSAVVAGDHRQA